MGSRRISQRNTVALSVRDRKGRPKSALSTGEDPVFVDQMTKKSLWVIFSFLESVAISAALPLPEPSAS
jgi:hypothetical protein